MSLNGNTFVISNKKYYHANLAQWGTNVGEVGTREGLPSDDNFWGLNEDVFHPGFYYIENVNWRGYRIDQWNNDGLSVRVTAGHYEEGQLWKFVLVEGHYFKIINYKYPNASIAKWGKSDIDWGSASNVEEYEDQVWQLTPRYKVSIQPVVIWSVDNRHGSLDFWEEVTINEGWQLNTSTEKLF